MTTYIVMEIGCIECGCASDIVGQFTSLEEARDVADKLEKNCDSHSYVFMVFELPIIGSINPDYLKALEDSTP